MTSKIIIDGENAVLGRIASFAAKQALQGKEVIIINAEKSIILGNEKNILENYNRKRRIGGWNLHGPFFPSTPEGIIKRTIRGMLPYKQEKGRTAYKRIKAYVGKIDGSENSIKLNHTTKKGITVSRISKLLSGGK